MKMINQQFIRCHDCYILNRIHKEAYLTKPKHHKHLIDINNATYMVIDLYIDKIITKSEYRSMFRLLKDRRSKIIESLNEYE